MKFVLFIPLFIAVAGCNSTIVKETESDKKVLVDTTALESCTCFDGVGSDKNSLPAYTYTFSNNKAISVCGYLNDSIISEFNVFNCKTGEILAEYGALSDCKINFRKDTLLITELAFLPDNDNWERNFIEVGAKVITVSGNELTNVPLKMFKVKTNISEKVMQDFLAQYEKGALKKMEPVELVLRLEAIGLSGNKKVYDILLEIDKKNAQSSITNAELGETLSEALNLLKGLN